MRCIADRSSRVLTIVTMESNEKSNFREKGESFDTPNPWLHSAGYSTSISLLIFNSDKTNSKIAVRKGISMIIDGFED